MKDHYNRKGRLSSIKSRFKEECPHCFEIIEKFEHTLKLNDYSIGRIEKYWSSLKTIHKVLCKCFDDVKKEDIEKFVISVNKNERWSEWTKSGFKSIIKFFFRWLLTSQITGDYPDMVKWVPTKMKKNNSRPPEKLLTKEEVVQLAKATRNLRDRALVLVLYETGCRIGELLNMKIKNIEFDDFGCYIMISGKTGWRRVRLINYSKDLVKWLDIHPFKENDESYVWISQLNATPNSTISPSLINGKLKKLAKKCNITKPVNPHSFRHARATHLSKELPEAIMRELFGWAKDSKMPSVYFHLSGKDVDEALLKLHGIKEERIKEVKRTTKTCENCGTKNPVFSHFCKNCKTPLDIKVMLKMEKKRKDFDSFLKEFFLYYSKMDSNFKRIFVNFVKENGYEKLFNI